MTVRSTVGAPSGWREVLLRPHVVLALFAAWIGLEAFALGPWSLVKMSDMADHILPMHLAEAIDPFVLNDWHRFGAAGMDRRALGVFGPVELVAFALLPGWIATILLTVGQLPMAAAFTYLLCRRLNLPVSASLFAGCCFASASANGRLLNSAVALLPFAIWAVSEAARRCDRRAWLALCAAALFYGGISNIQLLLPWPFLVIAAWLVVVERDLSLRAFCALAGFAAVALMLRAPDMVAAAVYSPVSLRSFTYLPNDSFHSPLPVALARLNSSTLSALLNIAPWSLFLVPALLLWRRVPGSGWFILFAAGLLLASYPAMLLKYAIIDWLPHVRGVREERMLAFMAFPLSVMGAYGAAALTNWLRYQPPLVSGFRIPPNSVIAAAFGLLLLFSFVYKLGRAQEWLIDGSYARNFLSPAMQDFASSHPAGNDPYRVASFQMHGSVANAYGLESVDGKLTHGPNRYREYWGKVIELYLRKDPDKYAIFWDSSGGSLFGMFYNFPHERVVVGENYDMELLSLMGARYIFARDVLVAPALVAIREMPKPWNSYSRAEKATIGLRENFTGRTHLNIYENRDAFPRFFLAGEIRLFDDKTALLAALGTAEIAELRRAVFAQRSETPARDQAPPSDERRAVRVAKYSADRIELEIEPGASAWLTATNAYALFWKCRVDGVETPIFPAYHAFWGVRLPEGARRIVFSYEPPYAAF